MDQTPIHESHNPDLLRIIPAGLGFVMEVGCSSGALAREYVGANSGCKYVGVEIDSDYAESAKRYCSSVIVGDIDSFDDSFYTSNSKSQCWIFGDTLEHLKDPWGVLRKIRNVISDDGYIAACIPNAQHWSLQAKLAIGDWRYEKSGLLDKTHLRWFTRQTILELFRDSGFEVVSGFPRVFDDPMRESILPVIGLMARVSGCDERLAIEDSLPLQYVVLARPC
ncbi:MAG: hypothetical protein RLZZ591_735 [Pseudomonadota bacterium]|jgi:SAM-dependent methyltransferase